MRGRYLVTAAVSITHMCNEITRTGCQLLECYVVDATSSRPRCHTHNTRLLLQQQQQQRQRQQQQQAVGGRPPRYAPAPLLPRGRRSALRRRADGNVAAVSHGQHVPSPTAATAWRANTAVSKAAWWPWPLTSWPWKWCPSHVWRGLPLCQFWSS